MAIIMGHIAVQLVQITMLLANSFHEIYCTYYLYVYCLTFVLKKKVYPGVQL